MKNIGFAAKATILIILAWAFYTAAPNVPGLQGFFSAPKTLNLGLDLQGGSHLVLQVDMDAVKTRALENLEDEIRRTLREEDIGYRYLRITGETVTFSLRDINQRDAVNRAFRSNFALEREIDANGQAQFAYTNDEFARLQSVAQAQTVEVLRTRVDAFGVAEPLIQRQGDDRVLVQLPGIDDVQRAKDAIGKTAQLTFHLVQDVPSASTMTLYEEGFPLYVMARPSITGEMLTSAGAGFDQMNQPAVDISFNARGTRLFARLSTDNVNRRFAIVLDGDVLSAPVFREPILGGRAQISGSFTTQESQDLATLLNAGALPTPVSVVEERTVGPSLGADSVAAGQLAMVIGFVGVLVFMLVFYGLFGIAANVALLVNVVLVVAVMTYVGFTLTLPGMAGIILTIGMAVDANVLIFERIREETRKKVKPITAIQNGFGGALSTILDANVTTLLASIVLFAMGSGPVKGFALTLAIGIGASMFTAIYLTRWILLSGVKSLKIKELPV